MKRRQFTAALGVLPLAGTGVRPGRRLAAAQCAHRLPVHAGRLAGQHRPPARRQAHRLSRPVLRHRQPYRRRRLDRRRQRRQVAPDGYSVLLGNIGSHALVPHLYAKPPYNAFTDLETVVWIGTQPNLLCCHPELPARHDPKADRGGQGRIPASTPTARRVSAPRRRSPWSCSSRRPAPTSPSSAIAAPRRRRPTCWPAMCRSASPTSIR